MTPSDKRLSAIEDELRRIADSLSLLTRLDERMVTLFKRTDDHETRLRVVEVGSASNSQSVTSWQKFGWIIAAALAAFGLNIGRDMVKPVTPPAVYQPAPHVDKPKIEGP